MLAVKVLQEQQIELLAITFVTPFFGAEKGIAAAEKAGVEVRSMDISQAHFAMLKSPRYGYGSQMNPCIDCHGLMLREAGKVMEAEGAEFLFTGEVLGQRPMSQRRDSLRSVEKLSGLPGRILRPLCAKLLPPTIVEEQGLVDRSMLLDVQGRSRRRQKELAQKYGVTDYPQPGGGCMLTNEGFSNRLRELLGPRPGASVEDVEIIKWGRAFMLPGKTFCMVGRQQSENESWSHSQEPGTSSCEPPIILGLHACFWRPMGPRTWSWPRPSPPLTARRQSKRWSTCSGCRDTIPELAVRRQSQRIFSSTC